MIYKKDQPGLVNDTAGNLNMNLIKSAVATIESRIFGMGILPGMHKSIGDGRHGYLDLEFDKDMDHYFTACKHPQNVFLNSICI